MTKPFLPSGERAKPPEAGSGKLAAPAPIVAPIPTPRSLWGIVLPIALVVGFIGFIVALYMSGMRSFAGGFGLFGVMMIVGYIGMFIRGRGAGGGTGQKMSWGELEKGRREYFSQQDHDRDEVEVARRAQWERAMFWHWDPRALVGVVGSVRMWEREPGSETFGEVRVGLGTAELSMNFTWPQIPDSSKIEPATGHALRKFVLEQQQVHDVPKVVWLQRFPGLSLIGDMAQVRGVARAFVCQLAAFHSPKDVQIMVATATPQEWDWAKWLPHLQHTTARDGCGERRLVFSSPGALENFIGDEQSSRAEWKPPAAPRPRGAPEVAGSGPTPLWVIIDDNCGSPEDWAGLTGRKGYAGVCFVRLAPSVPTPPPGVGLEPREQWVGFRDDTTYRLDQDGALHKKAATGAADAVGDGGPFYARADSLSVGEAARFARAMSRWRPPGTGVVASAQVQQRALTEVLRIGDPRHLDTDRLWAARRTQGSDWMKFPVGIDGSGQVVEVDLKEGAQGGWNMHSIHIGTTGAGKSEAILAEVTSLALTHSPRVANVVFSDFKFHSIGNTLNKFPHVVASMSNLADDRHLVGRMYEALDGELMRRGTLCANLGIPDLTQYNRRRLTDPTLEEVPALYIIWDEYQELFKDPQYGAKFQDLAWRIVRLGRAYHMFLKLVGQTVDQQKLREIHKLLGFAIAMRTGRKQDSREAIDSDVAAQLAPTGDEGTAFVRVAQQTPRKFRYFFMREPFVPPAVTAAAPASSSTWFEPRPFTVEEAEDIDGRLAAPAPEESVPEVPEPAALLTDEGQPVEVVEVLIEALNAAGVRPPRELWLPPLQQSACADELVARYRGRPWDLDYGDNPGVVFPVGIEDRPREARQVTHTLDLTAASLLVVGAPQSGVTTAVQTLIVTGALLYTPQRLQFYCIAAGGPQLSAVAGLPHVAAVAQSNDAEGVQRVIAAVAKIIADREAAFARAELDIEEFRRRKFGPTPDERLDIAGGDVVVVIDGWAQFSTEHPALVETALSLFRGLNYGVRVVVTNNSYLTGLKMGIRTMTTERLELRLTNPDEASMNREGAKRLAAADRHRPGAANTVDGVELLIGVPEVSGVDGDRIGVRDVAAVVAAVAGADEAAVMARLPERAPIGEVVAAADPARPKTLIPFGLNEVDLSVAHVDLAAYPHVMAVGMGESGRTNFLRVLCQQIMASFTPAEAQFYVFDPLRSMAGVVTDPAYLKRYEFTLNGIKESVGRIRLEMDNRVPSEGASQDAVGRHHDVGGPRIFVVIDNVSTWGSADMPFTPLLPLVDQADAVGLHILGSAKAESWPTLAALPSGFLGRIKTGPTSILVMNSRREFGKIAGDVKGAPMRPGKATLVTRNQASTVLVGWSQPG